MFINKHHKTFPKKLNGLIRSFLTFIPDKTNRELSSVLLIISLIIIAFFSIKRPVIDDPACTVMISEDGSLLAATIASDEQYRFPVSQDVPDKFARSVIEFEDRYFYNHPGINPFSIIRAALNNIKARRIVQGGSTITMQTVRLYRKGKSRTFFEKIIEAVLALRLELGSTKSEILSMYVSNAPFGGNVVGLDAAAWRYYGRSAHELSWAESAALAVLPNSPGLIFPGKNPDMLREKRDRLLKRLYEKNHIDSITYKLALLEPLPGKPKPLPQVAPHLLFRSIADGKKGEEIVTSLNPVLQERALDIMERHHHRLAGNQIHNAAILVLDVETNKALVYIGNTPGEHHGNYVDIITAPRSTGSILKPFLYASMLHDGMLLPNTLVPDIPTQIGGYMPKNFHPGHDGAVSASRAISRSLNVPAVRMLQQYGVERFHYMLGKLGLTNVTRSPENYGLSLILGGAEATLYDLAGVYAAMARTLNNYRTNQSRYNQNNYRPPDYVAGSNATGNDVLLDHSVLDASAIYFCFEAMKKVARPDELAGWQYFASSRSVAWKTGTSFGHRDAWAIGLNPKHVVAVWVGNASGEGRPNLTGVSAAAPILFDVFAILPPAPWFEKPIDDMAYVPVCRQSGHRASNICTPKDTTWIPVKGLETKACPYHKLVHLNSKKTHRVTDKCININEMAVKPWFVLPPAMEWFYRNKNPFYNPLPPYMAGCNPGKDSNPMALLYPRIEKAIIHIPRDLDGDTTEAIFEVAHRNDNTTIYWHLNDKYVGSTRSFHKMSLQPEEGNHTLTLVDEKGNMLETNFRIIGK